VQPREATLFAAFFLVSASNYIISPVRFALGVLVPAEYLSYLIYATTAVSVMAAQYLSTRRQGVQGESRRPPVQPSPPPSSPTRPLRTPPSAVPPPVQPPVPPPVLPPVPLPSTAGSDSACGIAITYLRSSIVMLAVLYACWLGTPGGSAAETGLTACLYVVAGVQPVLSLTLLWGTAAERYSPGEAVRFFGVLSGGATAGSILGSLATSLLAPLTGAFGRGGGSTLHLLVVAVAGLVAAERVLTVWCLPALVRRRVGTTSSIAGLGTGVVDVDKPPSFQRSAGAGTMGKSDRGGLRGSNGVGSGKGDCVVGNSRSSRHRTSSASASSASSTAPSCCEGLSVLLSSRFLSGICVFNFLYTMSATCIYIERTAAVAQALREAPVGVVMAAGTQGTSINGTAEPGSFSGKDNSAGATGFANSNLISAVLTLVTQVVMAKRAAAWIGVTGTLLLMPLTTVLGYVALVWGSQWNMGAAWQLEALAWLDIGRRLVNYGVAKPTREALFTVVEGGERRATKTLIDAIMSKVATLLGAMLASLWRWAGTGTTARYSIGMALALLWAADAVLLGRWYVQLRALREEEEEDEDAGEEKERRKTT
jgi:ATP/ADP translocase